MRLSLARHPGNPILAPTHNTWENYAVFNCGATIVDGRVALLYRAQGDDRISRFGLAFSDDGFHISERLADPIFAPDPDTEYETMGVEDPRITQIGSSYYITYTAASEYPSAFKEKQPGEIDPFPWRVRVSIAHTHDFRTFSRHGVILSHIDSKDAVLFPKKVEGNFLLLHRVPPDIRLAVGAELTDFKERGVVMRPDGTGWDSDYIGAGAPPIETPYGWVLLYHGVRKKRYSLGFALLDPHQPIRTLARTDEAALQPKTAYERDGVVDNVVFSCGVVVLDGTLFVYYGAADETIGVATMPFDDVLRWAKTAYHRYH